MKSHKLLTLCPIFSLLSISTATAAAASSSPQPSISQVFNPSSNLTGPPCPLQTLSYNGSVPPCSPSSTRTHSCSRSNFVRFLVPNSNIALDFDQQRPFIATQDVLMCLVTALAEIFGQPATQTLPDSSNFYYRSAFVHIQDLDPTPGRMLTYGDMVTTLRGVGEYMTRNNRFLNSRFWIWDVSTFEDVKIGLGALADKPVLHATSANTSQLGAPTDTS